MELCRLDIYIGKKYKIRNISCLFRGIFFHLLLPDNSAGLFHGIKSLFNGWSGKSSPWGDDLDLVYLDRYAQ